MPTEMLTKPTATPEDQQLLQTIEMFEVITQSQPQDVQSLEILKEAYTKLGMQKDVVETSKRIAEAYVQLGQLSSAIMEYETILQRFPDDPDVRKALNDIENKTNSFAGRAAMPEPPAAIPLAAEAGKPRVGGLAGKVAAEQDDGKAAMQRIFVDGKLVNAQDFGRLWFTPGSEPVTQVNEPFLQIMADKGLVVRNEEQRAHIYEAAIPQESTQRQLAGDLLERAFQGSAARLLQLRAGSVDGVDNLAATDAESLRTEPGVSLVPRGLCKPAAT